MPRNNSNLPTELDQKQTELLPNPVENLMSSLPKSKFSSDSEEIMIEYQEFLRAMRCEDDDRRRLYDNFKMYWGVEYGQWNDEVVQQLLNENRHPITLNLLSQKINALAGAITANQMDVDFVPFDGRRTSLTTEFKDVYLSDKNMMKYDQTFLQCAKYGLIYQGVEQMVIDDSRDPEGNISFRLTQPGFVLFSPDWKTDFAEECDKAWMFSYKNIEQIAEKYGVKTEELRTELALHELSGMFYEKTHIDTGREENKVFQHLYRVIEIHKMVPVKTRRLVDYSKGYGGLPFPVMHPEKDREYLIQWGNANNVNWDYVRDVPYNDKILQIKTIVPDVSWNIIFEKKAGKIQIRRLDFFPWCADRINGKNRGIIDLAKDLQQNFNKHQSQLTHMINSAANGGTLYNENLFGGDSQKMERLKQNKNNPAYVDEADLDAVERTHLVLKDQPANPALFANENLMLELLDIITPVPSAMSGKKTTSRESGILYQSKVAIAEIGMRTLFESLKKHHTDKAEAYYLQAQLAYRNTYRAFPKPDGTGVVELNKQEVINGEGYIINNISALPRCHVIVKESTNGAINRHMNRIMYNEMMVATPPNLNLLKTWFALKIAKTMETNDEEKKELDVVLAMEMAKALSAYKSEVAGLFANKAQAEMVAMQMEQQLGQMLGQMGGAIPGQEEQQATPESEIPKQLPPPESTQSSLAPEAGMEESRVNLNAKPIGLLQGMER